MIQTEVNSDSISEKYRKYVLGMVLNSQLLYGLQGADTTTFNYDDKYLTDEHGAILLFRTISSVVDYIQKDHFLAFDRDNLLGWAQEYRGSLPYSTFNLDRIHSLIKSTISLHSLSQADTIEILMFINLFGDYAYQREQNDPTLLLLHRHREISTFFDFAYDNYVWDDPEHAGYRSLNELDFLRFDEAAFRRTIEQMLTVFTHHMVVWKDAD